MQQIPVIFSFCFIIEKDATVYCQYYAYQYCDRDSTKPQLTKILETVFNVYNVNTFVAISFLSPPLFPSVYLSTVYSVQASDQKNLLSLSLYFGFYRGDKKNTYSVIRYSTED